MDQSIFPPGLHNVVFRPSAVPPTVRLHIFKSLKRNLLTIRSLSQATQLDLSLYHSKLFISIIHPCNRQRKC